MIPLRMVMNAFGAGVSAYRNVHYSAVFFFCAASQVRRESGAVSLVRFGMIM